MYQDLLLSVNHKLADPISAVVYIVLLLSVTTMEQRSSKLGSHDKCSLQKPPLIYQFCYQHTIPCKSFSLTKTKDGMHNVHACMPHSYISV